MQKNAYPYSYSNSSGNIFFWLLIFVGLMGFFSQIGYTFYLHRLKNDFRKKNNLLSIENDQMHKKFSQMELEFKSDQKELSHLRKQFEKRKESLENLKAEKLALEKSFQSSIDKMNEVLKKQDKTEKERDFLEKEKKTLLEQIRKIQSTSFLSETIKKNSDFKIQISHLEETLRQEKLKHKNGMEELKKNLEKNQLDLQQKSLSNSNMKSQFYFLKESKEKDQKIITRLEKKVTDSQKVATSLAQEMALKSQMIQKLKEKIQFIQKQYNVINNKFSKSLEIEENLKKKTQAKVKVISEKDKDILNLKKEILRVQSQFSHRLRELARAKDSLEKIIDHTRGNFMDIEQKKKQTLSFESASGLSESDLIVPQDQTVLDNQGDLVFSKKDLKKERQTFLDVRKKKGGHPEGQVIDLDYSQHLIVINLGIKNGLKENMTVTIMRDKLRIGTGKVVESREKISAANFTVIHNQVVRLNDRIVF